MPGATLVGPGQSPPGSATLPACVGARDVAVVTVGAAARADRLHQRRRFVECVLPDIRQPYNLVQCGQDSNI